MADNSKVRTLDDLIQYGITSDFSFPKVIQLEKVGTIVIPENITYDKYRKIIFDNLEYQELTIDQQKNYLYRPDRFAMDMYGNPNLSHLILYVNNCSSELEFKPEGVAYMSPEALGKVLKVILTHESERTSTAKKKALG